MADRPVLFSGPMVRALLEGRKTQTRRLAKPTWVEGANQNFTRWEAEKVGACNWILKCTDIGARIKVGYQAGDRLWVREAWNAFSFSQDGECAWPTKTIPTAEEMEDIKQAAHRYDVQAVYKESDRARDWFSDQKWRPGIHMPRWASRLTLVVTDVRVERLQAISEADAKAEGPHQHEDWPQDYYVSWREAFHALWDGLNEKRGFGWKANPWVVAITFTVHQTNIDAMDG